MAETAVVDCLLNGVLGVGGNLVDGDLGNAVVVEGKDVGAGALAHTAADAILVDRSLHGEILSLVRVPFPIDYVCTLFSSPRQLVLDESHKRRPGRDLRFIPTSLPTLTLLECDQTAPRNR